MKKLFIFDMDGVIIDSEPLHFEVDILTMKQFGVEITKEELEQFVGMTNPEMWSIIKPRYQLQQTIDELIKVQLDLKIQYLENTQILPIDGIPELIQQLKDNQIQLAIASSSPRRFIEGVLNKFNIADQFHYVLSGEEVNKGKPEPDIYLEVASQLKVHPDDCMVLEDSRNGVLAAKRANMYCIGYVNPNSGNQDLSLADKIVTSIHDIKL